MSPDDIPTDVTKLVYTCPLSISKAVSQNEVAALLAHYWPAIEKHIRAQVAGETVTDTTPITLRWDRLVMHPTGQDDHTIVACMTDDGQPVALFLDDEHREALGLQLVDPDPEGDACPLHSPTGAPCDCGHASGADCHPNARRTA